MLDVTSLQDGHGFSITMLKYHSKETVALLLSKKCAFAIYDFLVSKQSAIVNSACNLQLEIENYQVENICQCLFYIL